MELQQQQQQQKSMAWPPSDVSLRLTFFRPFLLTSIFLPTSSLNGSWSTQGATRKQALPSTLLRRDQHINDNPKSQYSKIDMTPIQSGYPHKPTSYCAQFLKLFSFFLSVLAAQWQICNALSNSFTFSCNVYNEDRGNPQVPADCHAY